MAAGEHKAKVLNCRSVDEGRKRVLLIAASILAARHLKELGGRPPPTLDSLIHDAVSLAAKIMSRIDAMFPAARA